MIGKSKNIFIFILLAIIAVSAQGVLKIYQETVGGKSYKLFYNHKLNWGNAFVACKAENADLITIDSLSELAYITKFIENAGIPNVAGEYFWTSGSDIYNEGHQIWMSNGREILKTIWSNGQPDNYGRNENCHWLWWSNGMFYLNDATCTTTNNFICETKLNDWI